MKNVRVIHFLLLLALLPVILPLSGCGAKYTIEAQFTKPYVSFHTIYRVQGMTIYMQHETTKTMYSGVTDEDGMVRFTVKDPGEYRIIKVVGKDATGGAIGSEGLEFVKESPLTSTEPLITYEFPDPKPVVYAQNPKDTPGIWVNLPYLIRKVTVLNTMDLDEPEPGYTYSLSEQIAGRIIIRNIEFGVYGALFFWSDMAAGNRLGIYINTGSYTPYGTFYSAASPTDLTGFQTVPSQPYPGPMVMEAPGNGDWAFSFTGATFTRGNTPWNGGTAQNFDKFSPTSTISLTNFSMPPQSPPARFKLRVEIYKFETLE